MSIFSFLSFSNDALEYYSENSEDGEYYAFSREYNVPVCRAADYAFVLMTVGSIHSMEGPRERYLRELIDSIGKKENAKGSSSFYNLLTSLGGINAMLMRMAGCRYILLLSAVIPIL